MAGSERLSRPRLLLVGGDGRPSGVPRHIRHLVRALAREAGITVASDVDHGGYAGLAELGAHHVAVPGLRSSLSPPRLWCGMRGLVGLLRHEEADLVWLHARLPVVLGRLALALRLWRPGPGARVVVTYHGLPFGPGHRPGLSVLSRIVERVLLRACPPLDLVFLTEAERTRMRQAMGAQLDRHRCHVLDNDSDLGPLPPPPADRPAGRHLVMTGRVGWQKNYALAIRLFAHLPEDFTVTLCGAGTDDPGFRARMARRVDTSVLARIRFAGTLSDIRPALAAADGYLLTSRYEGRPIGAIEAFEAGLPLILTRFPGSEALAAAHPLAVRLDVRDPDRAADEMCALVDTYLADREAASHAIQTAWAAQWSPEIFDSHARALVRRIWAQGPAE